MIVSTYIVIASRKALNAANSIGRYAPLPCNDKTGGVLLIVLPAPPGYIVVIYNPLSINLSYLFIALLLSFGVHPAIAAGSDSLRLHADLAQQKEKKPVQEVCYYSPAPFRAAHTIRCHTLDVKGDTILVYAKQDTGVTFIKGFHCHRVDLTATGAYIHPDYRHILFHTKLLPAGRYFLSLQIARPDTVITRSFTHLVDSSLSSRSALRGTLNDLLAPQKKFGFGNTAAAKASSREGKLPPRLVRKMERALTAKGLTVLSRKATGASYTDVYYKDRFIGYYRLDDSRDIGAAVDRERRRMSDQMANMTDIEPENIGSLTGQMKSLQEEKEKNKEITGEVGITGYAGNGQEELSQQDNNYYELRTAVNIPLRWMPVTLEAFYTSQDAKRIAKASYFRLHYDTESSKQELAKLISEYKARQEQVVSKSKGLDQVYGAYMAKLQAQKQTLLTSIQKDAGLPALPGADLDTSKLRSGLAASLGKKLSAADSAMPDTAVYSRAAAREASLRDSVSRMHTAALAKLEQVRRLEEQIQKYTRLTDQYRNAAWFDSLKAYDGLKDLEDTEDLSYRQLSRRAEGLLPDKQPAAFITGLTHLDIGIFAKDISAYTLAGQTIKGMDAGYDFGAFQVAGTAGAIEYIGRDGTPDRYTGYSGRVSFSPVKDQRFGLIYYGYMPGKRMLSDDEFFRKVDMAMPAFRAPVNIVAATWSGNLADIVTIGSEVAASFRDKAELTRPGRSADHSMAYRIDAEADIPRSTVTVTTGYDHIGLGFENNSLPVSLSGTDRYKAGAKARFFRNFLTIGAECNHLLQQSFSSSGGNTRWGFDIKTTSKRYPSAALSYKPFSTFRSYADTLQLPQRPLVGEVWTGRLSYQVRRKDYSLRFNAVYNKNSSSMDTVSYGSAAFQLSCIYTARSITAMLTAGSASMTGNNLPPLHATTKFLGLSGAYEFSERWRLSAGQDIAVARGALSRYAANAGAAFRLPKLPLTITASCRFNTYRLPGENYWKQLLGGSLDLLWQFRFSLKEQR